MTRRLKNIDIFDYKREFDDIPPLFVVHLCFVSSSAPSARSYSYGLRPRFEPIVQDAFQDAANGFNESFNYSIRRFLETGRRNAKPSEK